MVVPGIYQRIQLYNHLTKGVRRPLSSVRLSNSECQISVVVRATSLLYFLEIITVLMLFHDPGMA